MNIKFNEQQRRVCLLAVRCLNAATAVLLHKDEAGKPLMDRGSALLYRVGHNGDNLENADLTPVEVDTLMRALNVAHFVYVLSKTLTMPGDERQKTLSCIRQCMSAIR